MFLPFDTLRMASHLYASLSSGLGYSNCAKLAPSCLKSTKCLNIKLFNTNNFPLYGVLIILTLMKQ